MNNSTVLNIVDLSDEILIIILNKLQNLDVLYSFIGVNQKLDKLARDIAFIRSLDFVEALSNEKNYPMLDQFYSSWLERVLYIGDYPQLSKLTLVNLKLSIASSILNDESLFIHKFQQNISYLVLAMDDDITSADVLKELTNLYARIFIQFPNLTHFEFDFEDTCVLSPSPFAHSPSTSCYSSSIIYLRVHLNSSTDS